MVTKSVGIIALAALAMAAPDVQKRQSSSNDLAELLSLASVVGITALPTNSQALSQVESAVAAITAELPPASILSVLETAVPASVISDLANPTSASVFASQFDAGSTPGWYSSLPSNVQAFFSTYSPTLASLTAAEESLTSVSSTVASNSQISTTGSSSGTASSSGSATSSSASASATSTAGAAKATGAIAASLAGVVGILGLAVAL